MIDYANRGIGVAEMKDGGPAFPHMAKAHYQGMGGLIAEQITEGGMSLRDYFAAKALSGLIPTMFHYNFEEEEGIANAAKARFPFAAQAAYELADAMLAEREKRE